MATIRTLIGNIKGPKGDPGGTGPTGPTGPGATVSVGSVSTTDYGNPVQITNSGTETDAVFDFVIPQGKPGEQTTKMSGLTLDTITTQTAAYPIPAVGDVGSTAWGKIVKFFNDVKTALTSKINYSDCVKVLTSTDDNKPLAASQGKVLNDALASYYSVRTYTATYSIDPSPNYVNITNTMFNRTAITGYIPVGVASWATGNRYAIAQHIQPNGEGAGTSVVTVLNTGSSAITNATFTLRVLYLKTKINV